MTPQSLRNDFAALMDRYETEPEHVLQVSRLSLQLFDSVPAWHGLGDTDRLLLEAAACLHDIGWSVTQPDGRGHHKESARLIREHRWTDVPPPAIEVIALVARYHRKSIPDPEHDDFARLPEADQRRVSFLSAFLRIGDGLDRRHIQAVDAASAVFGDDGLLITASSTREIAAELAAAEKKADLLTRLYPGRVRFEGRRT